MIKARFALVLLGISVVQFGASYRILGVFPFNGKSHDIMFSALMRGLAERDHRVDVITHFPLKNAPENYKVLLNLNGTLKNMVNSFTFDFVESLHGDITYFIATTYGNELCELLSLPEMQKIIKNPPNDPPYDLVVTETFGANCYMGLGHLLKVPVVAVASAVEYPWITDYIGNNDNLAFVPNALLLSFDRTRFFDRLKNVVSFYWNTAEFHLLTHRVQTDMMRRYISPDVPDVREVERSVAVTIVNRHPVIYGAKPITSSLIEASGLHIDASGEKLPQDLKEWLDESVDGVVYFTFGSLVITETLPVELMLEFYESFSKIAPVRVLMKVVDETKLPPGLPKNILTSPWMPQQAILAHKNVRAFMTHGGLMGCQEALYHGVPLIGLPLWGDQPRNIDTFVEKNMSVRIDWSNLSRVSLGEALSKVLNDPLYKDSARYYSKLYKDTPMSAMDNAVFWIEYAIRNGPTPLRSPSLDLHWWQLALLDVYAFLLLSSISILALAYNAAKFCFARLFSSSSAKLKSN